MLKLFSLFCLFSLARLNPITKNSTISEGAFEGDIILDDLDGDGILTKNVKHL